jgi:hypothetical protein
MTTGWTQNTGKLRWEYRDGYGTLLMETTQYEIDFGPAVTAGECTRRGIPLPPPLQPASRTAGPGEERQ